MEIIKLLQVTIIVLILSLKYYNIHYPDNWKYHINIRFLRKPEEDRRKEVKDRGKTDECKRGYARSGIYVCQQKVENRHKKRCPLKAPENYL